jgi:hypothetical protein
MEYLVAAYGPDKMNDEQAGELHGGEQRDERNQRAGLDAAGRQIELG